MIEVQTGFRRRAAQSANTLEHLDPILDTGELDRALISLVGSVRRGPETPAALPEAPATAMPTVRRPGRARRTVLGLSRASLAAIAVTASLMGTAAVASGAYFTSAKSVATNTATAGTVKVRSGGASSTPYTVSNIVPLSSTDANDPAKGSILSVAVENYGTVPLTWSLQIRTPTTSSAAVGTALMVQTCVANCGVIGSWTAPLAVGSVAPVLGSAELAAAATTDVKYRFYLAGDAPNSTQGGTVSFSLVTKAMQGGTGVTPTTALFDTIPNP